MRKFGQSPGRDNRIDILRGAALWMILIDHVPQNLSGWVTLHVWGFSDAADVFVLLAGMSAMLAYGKVMARDGMAAGMVKIALRCTRIYVVQVALFLLTVGVVYLWTQSQHTTSTKLRPIFEAPATGLFYGLTLRALPAYLDILPLYIILLGSFPLLYVLLRRSVWLALGVSAALWLFANVHSGFDLPNWMDGKGWYFNPFAWQFLFALGAVLAELLAARPDGLLPYRRWAVALALVYLVGVFLEAAPFAHWGLPNLQPFPLDPPSKSTLAWPRLLDIAALSYLAFASPWFRRVAQRGWADTLAVCGRHSLEVFGALCVVALASRLAMRTYGAGLAMQVLANAGGVAVLVVLARWLDQRKRAARSRPTPRLLAS